MKQKSRFSKFSVGSSELVMMATNIGLRALVVLVGACLGLSPCLAQDPLNQLEPPAPDAAATTAAPAPNETVEVAPTADDTQIADRLQRILKATNWFTNPEVRVDEGVVFLSGTATNSEVKEWAGNLARRTQDVVAVVNQLEIAQPPLMDLQPASEGLRELWRDTTAFLPFAVFGFGILLVTWMVARVTAFGARRSLVRRLTSPLLREVFARAIGFLILLLGLYIVLRVSGLTRLALTVIGGTGILGLVLGIAFRDITENFLASVFLSIQRPFLVGDLVEIVGVLGYVQRLTVRTTVVMTLNGNQVEIPNSTVYKNTIRNFTTNKNRREDFTVGIGYDVPIPHAQEIALKVLRDHPAVLQDPEPWTLVESLGAATVTLRIYFWIDGSQHSWLKVKSSVIRLIKRGFQDAGISMPDEARELVFPHGVPVHVLTQEELAATATPSAKPKPTTPVDSMATEPVSTGAEAGLSSEAQQIEGQARQARETGEDNLLESS